jgi:hypothetical protein
MDARYVRSTLNAEVVKRLDSCYTQPAQLFLDREDGQDNLIPRLAPMLLVLVLRTGAGRMDVGGLDKYCGSR